MTGKEQLCRQASGAEGTAVQPMDMVVRLCSPAVQPLHLPIFNCAETAYRYRSMEARTGQAALAATMR